jgi:predicted ATPase
MWRYYQVGGDLQAARGLAEQCFRLAQSTKDPSVLLPAHAVMGITFYYVGEMTSAHKHFEQGMELYDPVQHRSLAFLYGEDQGVVCLARAAHILWMLGYPEQALQTNCKALTLARELSHPFSLVYALVFGSRLHELRREWQAVQEQAEEAFSLATEHGFAQWVAMATLSKGLALAMQGREEVGLTQLRQGAAAIRATGSGVAQPFILALLAKVYARRGQSAEALAALAEALDLAENYGIGWYLPEIHRLKGELHLEHAHSDARVAETCFRDSLEVARGQQAKIFELRAATSLARLWRQQSKPREAYDLLASIYAWFTEGFDTTDLEEAKALLEELAA